MQQSRLEREVALILTAYRLANYVPQYQFCKRRWRFDFAWPDRLVALEVDGELHHARYHQTRRDAAKRNHAVALGWRVIVATGEMVRKTPGEFIDPLLALLSENNIYAT